MTDTSRSGMDEMAFATGFVERLESVRRGLDEAGHPEGLTEKLTYVLAVYLLDHAKRGWEATGHFGCDCETCDQTRGLVGPALEFFFDGIEEDE